MTIYSEKSINHTAYRVRYDQIHPEIPEFLHLYYDVFQTSKSKWPLPAELYLVFSEELNCIQYFYSQILKSKTENIYIVAEKSGITSNYKEGFSLKSFSCCHEANKYFYLTFAAIHHIIDEPFIKVTDKLFTFEPNFVMQYKLFLRRICKNQKYVLTGQNSAVDLLLQSMIPVANLNYSKYFTGTYGTCSTPFGYPNKYSIDMAKSYLTLIKKSITCTNKSNLDPDPVFKLSVLLKMITPSYTDKFLRISNNEQIQEMDSYFDALQSIEVARACYQHHKKKIDAQLAVLKYPLKYMDKNSILYYQIETCIKNTSHSKLGLVNVFQYNMTEEYINEKAENKHLLWHGTTVSNVYSILKHGFDINRAKQGLYGKGVYFADAVGKSQNYCRNLRNIKNNFKGLVLLLCEVKLGRIGFPNDNDKKIKKSQCDSYVIKGRLRPKDEAYFRDDFAAKFYSQSHDINNDFEPIYGEFVVFDTKRIKIRYVVHCEKYYS